MNNHKYTVEFRIYGKDVNPVLVSQELGLIPCQEYAIGSKIGKKVRDRSMWAFSGGDSCTVLEWKSLEEGLNFVLDKLWLKRTTIQNMYGKSELIWWCGQFQSGSEGGPTLSPTLLKRLGEFGVELFIDCYFSKDNSEFQEL